VLRQVHEALHDPLVHGPAHRAELLGAKRLTFRAHEHGTTDLCAQFADVAGPVVPQEEIQGGPADPANSSPVVNRGLPDESENEFRDIFPAIAEGRNVKLQPSESVVEIGTKVSLFGRGFLRRTLRRPDQHFPLFAETPSREGFVQAV
jgi:hypothetical protein